MMTERGVAVDHSTIYRWVQRFAPEMEKRLRWQWRRPQSRSWRVDETYIKVRGKWAYLYRAVDKLGNTIDFYLSATRNTKAAKRFLGKALRGLKEWEQPEVLNTDKAPAYAAAIAELKAEGKCPKDTRHRQVKYLNNVIEADHGKLKLLIRPVRGFKTLKTAYATIKGFEVMRALRKGQAGMFALQGGIVGEARIVERAFALGPCALTEAMALLQDCCSARGLCADRRDKLLKLHDTRGQNCTPNNSHAYLSSPVPAMPSAIRLFRTAEGLNTTTRRAEIGAGSLVFGLRPRRSPLSRNVNVPNPEIFTASPASSRSAIASMIESTNSADSRRDRPISLRTASLRSARVTVAMAQIPSSSPPA